MRYKLCNKNFLIGKEKNILLKIKTILLKIKNIPYLIFQVL